MVASSFCIQTVSLDDIDFCSMQAVDRRDNTVTIRAVCVHELAQRGDGRNAAQTHYGG